MTLWSRVLLAVAVLVPWTPSSDAADQASAVDDATTELVRTFPWVHVENEPRGTRFTITGKQLEVEPYIDADAEPAFERIAEILIEYPDRPVLVEAYTDGAEAPAYNLAATERHAAAARDMLVRAGLESDRVEFCGYGDAFPQPKRDVSTARPVERRIDIVLAAVGMKVIPSRREMAGTDQPADVAGAELEVICSSGP